MGNMRKSFGNLTLKRYTEEKQQSGIHPNSSLEKFLDALHLNNKTFGLNVEPTYPAYFEEAFDNTDIKVLMYLHIAFPVGVELDWNIYYDPEKDYIILEDVSGSEQFLERVPLGKDFDDPFGNELSINLMNTYGEIQVDRSDNIRLYLKCPNVEFNGIIILKEERAELNKLVSFIKEHV